MRHFVGLQGCERARLETLISQARSFRTRVQSGEHTLPLLDGRMVALLFHEPSTRTRFSFETACHRLGARILALGAEGSSAAKGETLLDTARTLQALGADALVLRHKTAGAPEQVREALEIPVINAGDGAHEHPTQALLDLLTIGDHFEGFAGLTVGIVGDTRHSRVARSGTIGLRTMGARVVYAGPDGLCGSELEGLGAERLSDVDSVVSQVDVLMMLRVQHERLKAGLGMDVGDYRSAWGLTERRAEHLRPHAIVMHPGPLNRGVEIDDAVADGPRSVVFEQMANGVFARMAVLCEVLQAR